MSHPAHPATVREPLYELFETRADEEPSGPLSHHDHDADGWSRRCVLRIDLCANCFDCSLDLYDSVSITYEIR
jgi:hypothetical protein